MEAGMAKYLVTGGAGFFGGILKNRLLEEGAEVVSVDLVPDAARHPSLTSILADIRDQERHARGLCRAPVHAVFHIAAQLAHDRVNHDLLWTSNVDGTQVIARCA